uniref:UBC core domain-containing protein n=1 Tax=Nelumbo nucifera TaxID=4432 RepID=A0A822Z988_NELNU|nr:TPA_asm: hypothetical protein HUJ06_015925 [Nelumbo nucifera]
MDIIQDAWSPCHNVSTILTSIQVCYMYGCANFYITCPYLPLAVTYKHGSKYRDVSYRIF